MRVVAKLIHGPKLFRSEVPAMCVWVKKTFCLEADAALEALQPLCELPHSGLVSGVHTGPLHTIHFFKLLISHPSSFHSSLPVQHRDNLVPLLPLPPPPTKLANSSQPFLTQLLNLNQKPFSLF